jgi:hypothetical protein
MNQKIYWLRGGVIGGLVGLFVGFIFAIFGQKFSAAYSSADIIPLFFWPLIFGVFFGLIIVNINNRLKDGKNSFEPKRYWLRGGLLAVGIILGQIVISRILFHGGSQYFLESILEAVLFPPTLVGLGFWFAMGALGGKLYEKGKNKSVFSVQPEISVEDNKKYTAKIITRIVLAIILIPILLWFTPYLLINSYCTVTNLVSGQKVCDSFFDY